MTDEERWDEFADRWLDLSGDSESVGETIRTEFLAALAEARTEERIRAVQELQAREVAQRELWCVWRDTQAGGRYAHAVQELSEAATAIRALGKDGAA